MYRRMLAWPVTPCKACHESRARSGACLAQKVSGRVDKGREDLAGSPGHHGVKH